MEWEGGKLTQVERVSKWGKECVVKYGDRQVMLSGINKGEKYMLDADLKKM
jgi:hypothetical protein